MNDSKKRMRQHSRCCLLLFLGTLIGLLVFIPNKAMAQQAAAITAPNDTAVVWVDVEGNVDEKGIRGAINGKSLEFHASPSGVTAIQPAQSGDISLTLETEQDTSARVVVTFAEANKAVLAETATMVDLKSEGTDIKLEQPVPPQSPVNNPEFSAAASSQRQNAGNQMQSFLAHTGGSIVVIAVVTGMLLMIGLLLFKAGKMKKGE